MAPNSKNMIKLPVSQPAIPSAMGLTAAQAEQVEIYLHAATRMAEQLFATPLDEQELALATTFRPPESATPDNGETHD